MNTIELLRELEAKAHELLQADIVPNEALVALEKLADKHLPPLLEALDETPCDHEYHFHRTSDGDDCIAASCLTPCDRCKALAALHTDLEAALRDMKWQEEVT